MHKKFFIALAALAIEGHFANAQDMDSWSIQVSGAAYQIKYTDFNDMVRSFNQTYADAGVPRMETRDRTMGLNAEVLFRLNRFQVGFGVGYLTVPEFTYRDGEGDLNSLIENYELKHSATARVVSLMGAYDLLSLSRFTLYGGAGIAYYMASLTFDEIEIGDPYGASLSTTTVTRNSELSSSQFGLKAHIGLDVKLTSRLSLDARFNARLASISGFMGTQKRHEVEVGNWGTTEDQDTEGVYLVRQETDSGEVEFGPSTDRPLGTLAHDEGTVDLSGFGVQLGIQIHFPQ